jgi:diaminohydroxyphosphoribosylaminopyrimidine deaminase/5-amino-6-(5-phosphoribosylamino)uracil reductase
VNRAGAAARGCTAYLNLETGDSHGDMSSVSALISRGVSRVVIGLLHPLSHLRGQAVAALKAAGVHVDVLQQHSAAAQEQQSAAQRALQTCLQVNEVRRSLQPAHAGQAGWGGSNGKLLQRMF